MARVRSVFEVIGPVMIGPSSSHTAGAVRLGNLARAVFGEAPVRADVTLHGSFASTGRGHGTDLALIAGLLGFAPDDERIRTATGEAAAAGLTVTFAAADLGEVHPNTASIALTAADGRQGRVQGSSVGGADVIVTGIDDFDVSITGELPVLVVEHTDRPGVVAAVTALLAGHAVNIASMEVSREMRGARALMVIETDQPVTTAVATDVGGAGGVTKVRTVPAV
ncbi:MAG: L-serine ammonia-lyase, iron-sulfur-dependent subunit beta [Coriobacteriia bacterium]|nr:L-serine ammonia-lyase, iron-sulfur-dependent subunit beta [Coriobacteriia bacterium]